MKKVLFYCNANNHEGLGHFMRCLNLSQFINQQQFHLTFCGDFNEFAVSLLNQKKITYTLIKNIEELLKFKTHYLFADTYLISDGMIEKLSGLFRLILFDDFCNRNYYNTYAIINFTIGAPKLPYKAVKHKLLGTSFFPYRPEWPAIRKRNLILRKVHHKEKNNILVMFSGVKLEPARLIDFLNVLDHFYSKCTFHVIYYEKLPSEQFKNNHIILYQKIDNITEFYSQSDLVISGGGLAKYESAFCGIPNLAFSITPEQHKETIEFEKYYLTYHIGTYFQFDPKYIQKRIEKFYNTPALLTNFYTASQQQFNENALQEKINKILE
ncbi:MAG: hypothetical protein N3F09_03800 [Bacteroidia bacterium]|nr:hypothetical protein [Bacteroidia bacterium]